MWCNKMMLNVNKSKFKLTKPRKNLLFVSLLFVLLISCLSSCALLVKGAESFSEESVIIHVNNETGLRNAVSNAANGVPVIIVFDEHILLGLRESTPLIIPSGADVTLTSNSELTGSNIEFFNLYGANGANTITVNSGGALKLLGITVTHVPGTTGNGITVNSNGLLIMYDGTISDNMGVGVSVGGVFNSGGSFVMEGGVISGNTIFIGGGGTGVSISGGSFVMRGGVISGNEADRGGGVFNSGGSFVMEGGVISGNTASSSGGGVYTTAVSGIGGSFVMEGGVISGNTASREGGGVYISGTNLVSSSGSFVMEGGVISGNTVGNRVDMCSGGGVYNMGSFVMNGGEISGNTAQSIFSGIPFFPRSSGGGIYTGSSFVMNGGEISGNTANCGLSGSGGGVYVADVSGSGFVLYGGKISGNVASGNGGGVWVTDSATNFDRFRVPEEAVGVIFENNRASVAYDIALAHVPIYRACIEGEVLRWSTPFTQGYNNYDVSYVYGTPTSSVYYIHVPSVVGKMGDEVTLTVTLENNPGIAMYSLTMKYPTELEFVRVTKGDILGANFQYLTTVAGQVSVGATSENGADVASGTVLFTITFRINEEPENGVIDNLVIGFFRPLDAIEHAGSRLAFTPAQIIQGEIKVEPVICVHDYVGVVTKVPTCVETGVETFTCSKCGHSYAEVLAIDPSNHVGGTYEAVITPATFESEGLMGIYCSGCNAQLDTRPIPRLVCVHDYVGVVTSPATCVAKGVKTFTCSECGDSYTEDIPVDPANHVGGSYERVIAEPTFESEGLMGIYCSGCNALLRTEPIDKLSDVQKDYEFLEERAVEILKNGLNQNNLHLNGKVLTLVIDGREFVLSTNANNRNIEGEIDLGDGYFLKFDIKGNGSNIKMFNIVVK